MAATQAPFTEYISTRWYRAPECLLTDGALPHAELPARSLPRAASPLSTARARVLLAEDGHVGAALLLPCQQPACQVHAVAQPGSSRVTSQARACAGRGVRVLRGAHPVPAVPGSARPPRSPLDAAPHCLSENTVKLISFLIPTLKLPNT